MRRFPGGAYNLGAGGFTKCQLRPWDFGKEHAKKDGDAYMWAMRLEGLTLR